MVQYVDGKISILISHIISLSLIRIMKLWLGSLSLIHPPIPLQQPRLLFLLPRKSPSMLAATTSPPRCVPS